MTKKIITRFAPSPTGALHIGAARTALFNFAFSEQQGGEMILRIEDTDKERSLKKYEEDILQSLKWLSIEHSKLFKQSERTDIYHAYIKKLIEDGHAYGAEEGVIRFRNPNKKVSFEDLVRGTIEFETTELGDFVIARSDTDPLYNLAVVIDDHEMNITHLIRGEDHISNTPRQILIQEAIGAERPLYAHIPLILAPDRSKLSKRHGAMPISEYHKEGYLPEAIINFMALLGWSPQGKRDNNSEIFTLSELIQMFSLKGIQKGGAMFDIQKLRWVNHEHIKKLSLSEFEEKSGPFLPREIKNMKDEVRHTLLSVLQEKAILLTDIKMLYASGELSYFFTSPKYKKEELLPKGESSIATVDEHIDKVMKLLSSISTTQFKSDVVKNTLWPYATEKGRGAVLWPFRFALSGKEKSSDPFIIAHVLGKKETLSRLAHARELLARK